MTKHLELLDSETLVISATQREELTCCPRRWKFRYIDRRVPAFANAAANAGKAFDCAINLRYSKLGATPVDPATEEEMLALVDQQFAGVELPIEEYRTAARIKDVVRDYNAYWKQEPFTVLGVQVPFAVELGSVPVPAPGLPYAKPVIRVVMHGIMDLFVRLGDHVFVVDTKTSKSGREGVWENSSQLKGYMWCLQQLARLHPDKGFPVMVHGAFVNEAIIRPPYKAANRTAKDTDRPRNEFARTFPAFYTQERLEEWRNDTLFWVEQALWWVVRDHYPQNEKVCPMHYGVKCGFLQVCTLPAAQREMALASDAFMDYERGPLGEVGGKAEVAP